MQVTVLATESGISGTSGSDEKIFFIREFSVVMLRRYMIKLSKIADNVVCWRRTQNKV